MRARSSVGMSVRFASERSRVRLPSSPYNSKPLCRSNTAGRFSCLQCSAIGIVTSGANALRGFSEKLLGNSIQLCGDLLEILIQIQGACTNLVAAQVEQAIRGDGFLRFCVDQQPGNISGASNNRGKQCRRVYICLFFILHCKILVGNTQTHELHPVDAGCAITSLTCFSP